MYWNEYWHPPIVRPALRRAFPNLTFPFPFSPLLLSFVRFLLRIKVWYVALLFAIVSGLAQFHIIYGQSMEPNFVTNQRIIAENVSYWLDTPNRGDVVILEMGRNDTRLIKRVIALADDVVEIRDSQLYINGRLLTEPYFVHDARQANYGPLTIPESHIFVLGDNRGNSNDSRYFGPISITNVTSRAWLSYWPLTKLGSIP